MDDTTRADAQVGAIIEKFVRGVGAVAADDPAFDHHTDLVDSGYLDSLGLVALTSFLEDTFTITLTEEDLFDPAFTTMAGIARLVTTRRSSSQQADAPTVNPAQ